jgi:hypothetical protein
MVVKPVNFVTVRTRTGSGISFIENISSQCKAHLDKEHGIIKGTDIGGFFVTSRNARLESLISNFFESAHFLVNATVSLVIVPKSSCVLLSELESSFNFHGLKVHEQWETEGGYALCFFDKDVEQAKSCITAALGFQDF